METRETDQRRFLDAFSKASLVLIASVFDVEKLAPQETIRSVCVLIGWPLDFGSYSIQLLEIISSHIPNVFVPLDLAVFGRNRNRLGASKHSTLSVLSTFYSIREIQPATSIKPVKSLETLRSPCILVGFRQSISLLQSLNKARSEDRALPRESQLLAVMNVNTWIRGQ